MQIRQGQLHLRCHAHSLTITPKSSETPHYYYLDCEGLCGQIAKKYLEIFSFKDFFPFLMTGLNRYQYHAFQLVCKCHENDHHDP